MLKLVLSEQSPARLYGLIAITSLGFTLLSVVLNHVINNDGVVYLHQASKFGQLQWQAGLAIYKWPAYALSIAGFSALTGLSELHAAHALNAFFTIGLCLLFVRLVSLLGGNGRTLIFAAFIILFYYGINRYRAFIIRDPGYLFFYLGAIYQFILYFDSRKYIHFWLCLASLILATAFRIEGFIFVVVLPLFFIHHQLQRRRSKWLLMLVFVLATAALYTLYLWWSHENEINTAAFFSSNLKIILATIYENYFERSNTVNRILFAGQQLSTSHLIVALTAICIVIISVIAKLDILLAILVYVAIRNHSFQPQRAYYKLWRLLVIINFCILLNFVADNLFLAQRYAVTLTVTLLLAVPFVLERFYLEMIQDNGVSLNLRGRFFVCIALITLIGGNGLLKVTSKGHLKEAAHWVQQQANPGDTLYTNSRIMAFYSDRPKTRVQVQENWDWVSQLLTRGLDKQHDYLLLDIGDNPGGRTWMDRTVGRKPDFSAHNRHGSYVYVYRRP